MSVVKQMLYDLDVYVDEKLGDDNCWWGDVADMVDIVEGYQEVRYENFNNIRCDFDKNLGLKRRKSIYADDKLAWSIGRIEFLESIIKKQLGNDYFDKHCKELD